MWLLVLACAREAADPPGGGPDPAPPAWIVTTAAPAVESVAGPTTAAAPVLGYALLVWDIGPRLIGPDGASTDLDPSVPPPLAATRAHTGELILLTETDLLTVGGDGLASPSPLLELLPEVPRTLAEFEGDLWLGAGDRLWRWRSGVLAELHREDQPISGHFAVGGRVGARPVVWVEGADGALVGLDVDDGAGRATIGAANADDWAVDDSGRLWFTAGGALFRREANGDVWEVPVGAEAWWVEGSPYAPGVWVETAGAPVHVAGDVVTETTVGPGADGRGLPTGWTVDDLGRLIARRSDALTRTTVGRPLGILGILPGEAREVATTVSLVGPELPAEVTWTLARCVPGAWCSEGHEGANPLAGDAVDPPAWGGGTWWLAAEAAFGDGETAAVGREIRLISEVATWLADVEPLFELRCAACHGAGSNATPLDTKESWITFYASIVDRTVYPEETLAEPMPFGDSDGLPQAERELILAWGDADFP